MNRLALSALAGVLGVGTLVASPDTAAAQQKAEPGSAYRIHSDTTAAQHKAPPGGAYKKVSSLVALPDFIPGLGTLYVDPTTLPAGPFLAYDRAGTLVSSIYMIPLKDIEAQKAFNNLNVAKEKVDHVDLYYNAGHPGVAVGFWLPGEPRRSLRGHAHRRGRLRLLLPAARGGGHDRSDRRRSAGRAGRAAVRLLQGPAGSRALEAGAGGCPTGVSERRP